MGDARVGMNGNRKTDEIEVGLGTIVLALAALTMAIAAYLLG